MAVDARSPRARRDQRGTALMLVPASALIVLALGAIAVDMSLLHSAHRSTHRAVSAAADDAAAMIDERHLQVTVELRVDPDAARRVVGAQMETASLPGTLVELRVDVDPVAGSVTVRATVLVEHVLLPATPLNDDVERLVVTSSARIAR